MADLLKQGLTYVTNFLMCQAAVVLKDVVVVGTRSFDELLGNRLYGSGF